MRENSFKNSLIVLKTYIYMGDHNTLLLFPYRLLKDLRPKNIYFYDFNTGLLTHDILQTRSRGNQGDSEIMRSTKDLLCRYSLEQFQLKQGLKNTTTSEYNKKVGYSEVSSSATKGRKAKPSFSK